MRVDGGIMAPLHEVPKRAKALEEFGYDGLFTAEVNNDPLLPLLLAAEHTDTIELVTSIVVAFARSPMTLAQTAHDLQVYSGGRLHLGLGSQVRGHITRRFSMEWSRPAARMREYVLALRAIWATWNEGAPLDFEGEFYRHTLMTPNFTPPASPDGPPKVLAAAVGPRMTEVAAEVADGVILHGFTTERYVREVTLPALERGWQAGGRDRRDFQIVCPLFVVTGADDAQRSAMDGLVRGQIAFYGSTPAYRPVLEIHGWADLGTELTAMSKQGRWGEMGALIDDDVVDAFAVVADPEDLPAALLGRYGGIVDRLPLMLPFAGDNPDLARSIMARVRAE